MHSFRATLHDSMTGNRPSVQMRQHGSAMRSNLVPPTRMWSHITAVLCGSMLTCALQLKLLTQIGASRIRATACSQRQQQ